MNFEKTLISGELIKRYKRFFVDIKINNKIVTAHCPNTGSMMGLLNKGNRVWLSASNNPKRKLKYTLQIIESKKSKVGVNTHLTNKIGKSYNEIASESRSMHNRAALSALAAVRIEQHNARSWWAFRDALMATHRNPWRVLVALSGILKYVDDRGESSTFARNAATKEIDDLCKLDSCCIHPACVSKSVPP